MSQKRGLKVSFDPERFGTTEDYRGKPVLWPAVDFSDGTLVLDESKDQGRGLRNQKKYIEMLREHPCNKESRDSNKEDFWELEQGDATNMLTMQLFAEGKPISQAANKKLKSDDIKHLQTLERWVNKQFAPTQFAQVVETVITLKERFEVLGVETPTTEMSSKKLKAICVLLLDFFETSGIWNGETLDEGEENT